MVLPVILAFLALAGLASGQALGARPPIPVEQTLRGPERRDLAWDIRILPPRLTYQQRHLVEVRVGVDPASQRQHVEKRELHFVVKVADAQGRWLPGEDYLHYSLERELDKKQELEFVTGLYMRPGTYTLAALLYDSLTEELNVARKIVEVAPVKHDALPQLDRDLPEVEFLPEVPHDRPAGPAADPPGIPPFRSRRFPGRRLPQTALQENAGNQTWALGAGREWLPVSNARPLRVDIVLNFSRTEDPRGQGSVSGYRQNAGALLQIGSVLSHLGVTNGCVRVSGVDVLRMRQLFDETDAAGIDWRKLSPTILQADTNTVDVGTLAGRTRASAFFHDFLTRIFSESGCGPEHGAEERVVIVVGRDTEFASGTKVEHLAEDSCHCRLYYLDLPAFSTLDQIEGMLKPAKPRRFRIADPQQFRRALAEILRDLGPTAADRAQ